MAPAWIAAAFIVLAVGLGPWALRLDPTSIDLSAINQLPSAYHLLGTDDTGRDLLARLLAGGQVSLGVASAATVLATIWGAIYGAAAGLGQPWLDALLMRIVDALLAFPNIVAVLIFAAIFPAGIRQLILLLALTGWMQIARLVRGVTRDVANMPFLEAARSAGAVRTRLILRHVLPNISGVIGVAATLELTKAILAEATVSFLGAGIHPPMPSWGNMLTNAQDYVFTAPWLALAPGVAISATVFVVFRMQEWLHLRGAAL
ncbi:MAG TPA: ABC transporter permease [Chloroflexota bacterium]|nr:ABC transporter permease [Chloroflexota bacterium]